jgi:broad specificity phosphatase PhoE
MRAPRFQLWLMRHGETKWSQSGAHTGRTDIPLTPRGRSDAIAIGESLRGICFSRVITSPLQRARETCRIAGFGDVAEVRVELSEWDYGRYEGLTTAQVRKKVPGWSIWSSDPPGGEPLAEVGTRAAKLIEECASFGGRIALFSHAHFLRILAAVWVGLPPNAGKLLALHTGSVSILGFERDNRVIEVWNRFFEPADCKVGGSAPSPVTEQEKD